MGQLVVTSTFFDDLSELLNRVVNLSAVSYRDPVGIVGDVNVCLDRVVDPNSRRLAELLDIYGMHHCAGLLDIVQLVETYRCRWSP